MTIDPLEKVRLLMKVVQDVAKENGLELYGFNLLPSMEEGGIDKVSLSMVLTPEALETLDETEKRKTDDVFAQMMSSVSFEGFDEASELPEEVQERINNYTDEILGAYNESDASETDERSE